MSYDIRQLESLLDHGDRLERIGFKVVSFLADKMNEYDLGDDEIHGVIFEEVEINGGDMVEIACNATTEELAEMYPMSVEAE